MALASFLGLGVMGYPMAGHLSKAGYETHVWNRTKSKSENWSADYEGQAFSEIEQAVAKADFVFMCLGDDPDVKVVAERALAAMKRGAVLVDHTTASAQLARELYEHAQVREIAFMDAPVSGGQIGAQNGQLSIMCGGDAEVFASVQPVMQSYAKAIVHSGKAGAGQLTKMVNQICIAGLVQGLAEGLHFAQQAGLEPETVISAISQGAAQSWQMENRWKTMIENDFDFGFAVNWMRKDLRIALEEGRRNHAQLPVTALVDQFYADIQAMDGGRWDTSSLIARLQNKGRN